MTVFTTIRSKHWSSKIFDKKALRNFDTGIVKKLRKFQCWAKKVLFKRQTINLIWTFIEISKKAYVCICILILNYVGIKC